MNGADEGDALTIKGSCLYGCHWQRRKGGAAALGPLLMNLSNCWRGAGGVRQGAGFTS